MQCNMHWDGRLLWSFRASIHLPTVAARCRYVGQHPVRKAPQGRNEPTLLSPRFVKAVKKHSSQQGRQCKVCQQGGGWHAAPFVGQPTAIRVQAVNPNPTLGGSHIGWGAACTLAAVAPPKLPHLVLPTGTCQPAATAMQLLPAMTPAPHLSDDCHSCFSPLQYIRYCICMYPTWHRGQHCSASGVDFSHQLQAVPHTLTVLAASQSSPSYKPSPRVATAPCTCHFRPLSFTSPNASISSGRTRGKG